MSAAMIMSEADRLAAKFDDVSFEQAAPVADGRRVSEVEIRSAQVADVSYPKRQIELIVMPYETVAEITENGRTFAEICSRGAFDGVESRTSNIKVNMDHKVDVRNTIGKTLALHPRRPEGLVAEVEIVEGEIGDHALRSAALGSIGASAGFQLLVDKATKRLKQNAEVWETRSRRRLNHLWLHHIALTPDPAHHGAVALDVRSTPGSTQEPLSRDGRPNFYALTIQQQRAEFEAQNRRYGR